MTRRNGAQPVYHRIVAKLGTNLLTAGTDRIDPRVVASLVGQAARLMDEHHDVVIVTSGAIAAGRERLQPAKERRDIPFRQVLASVGQVRLLQVYDRLFAQHGRVVAQTLVSRRDLLDRAGYL
ncbi:MAG TPA: glutamate 5-kinase, partial [Candidatus Limnocylindria bacterium]|nr:glutamate 5-kinase [Candidatus Limnocylindria bacterium]